ncbi:Hypothetical predicted protein [Olea europaea subsp. europaea]|uniref:Uncharacterized protein n=1 Tax=Olea europaea subsp. europaea TaxID=158383 RepID=A0A8S0U4C3_OLEEU|nr:Hypothetical predicted protein [Olea europaea subsp. europaea]
MSGSYSRIRKVNKTRSKSIDLSDLSFPYHTPRSIAKNTPKSLEIKQNNLKKNPRMPDSIPEDETEDGIGEIFGDVLNRNCFVPSHEDGAEKSYIQTVVKRSFSLKRSSSVSEGYSRIHHQCDLTAANEEDDEEHMKNSNSQAKPMRKKGKILQACRRLFGF